MSDNTKDIDTTPDADTSVWDALVAAAPAGDSDATKNYWANAWANRGV